MILHLIGTVSIISSDFSRKDGNNWFTMVPLKALLIKYELDIKFWKLVIFNCGFSTKVTCAFQLHENMKDLSQLNTLNLEKRHLLLLYWSDNGFKGIRHPSLKVDPCRYNTYRICSPLHCLVRLPSEESTQHVLCNKCSLVRLKCSRVNWVLHYSPFKPFRQSQRFNLRR